MVTNPTASGPIDLRDVAFRSPAEADRRFAEALYLATMLPLLSALGIGDEERLRARFARGYRPDCSEILHLGRTDIGWIQVSDLMTELHLDQLHLVSAVRGCGLGSRLVSAVLARARRSGRSVGLDVIRGNPAFRLYRRLGFEVEAEDEEKHQMRWRPDRGSALQVASA